MCRCFLKKLKVKYLVDNDKSKYSGKYDEKYMIYSPNVLSGEKENSVLIITSTYYDEIMEPLKQLDFKGEVWSFLHLREKQYLWNIDVMDRNMNKLFELLSDE